MKLKNPKFGNTWTIDTAVKTDYALGGPLIQVHDTDWPIIESFEMSFDNLSITERDSLENFLVNTAGEEIIITDLEHRNWKGVFMTDPIQFVVSGRNCKWEITLQFQGMIQ